MGRRANLSESAVIHVTVSVQSDKLLDDLARRGVWGRSGAEVAARFIDQALERFVGVPKLKPGPGVRKAKKDK